MDLKLATELYFGFKFMNKALIYQITILLGVISIRLISLRFKNKYSYQIC